MDNSVEKVQRARFWTYDPRVRGIVENVADGIIGIDVVGYIELFNPAAERLFGYTAGEAMGRNVKLLMPDEVRAQHDAYLAHYLQTGERHIIGSGREVEGRRRDGTTFPMYLSVGEVQVPGFRGFIGIVHDLSAQKATEQELAKAGELLQALLDSMPSILVGIDREGRVTHWNRAAAHEHGIDAEQAIGRPFVELFPLFDVSPQEVARTIGTGVPLKRERLPWVSGGETRYMDLMIYPLDRDISGAVVRLDDVTERARMEEIMVQTEKMLSVGGLAAGMAHEINNPLGIIAQGCQNLQRRVSLELAENQAVAAQLGLDLERVREYLERRGIFRFLEGVQEATARASRIINDMLAYSRRSASSFVPVRLGELVDTVLRLANHDYDLKKSYDFRRIKIHREGDEDAEVCCDDMAIEQVLLNLLRNSAQAMAAYPTLEAPEIKLRIVDEGAWVCLEISDNGPGMNDEVARRIFEPFFTTKPVGVGTGLGLSVAYFIVTQQHHGTLQVQSVAGQGARFTIRLPRQGRPYGPHDSGRR